MDINYWNKVAVNYESEIFDVYATNKGAVLQKYLKKHTNKNHSAIDFGCGVGKAFSILSPGFKNVLALDISQVCIDASALVKKTNNYSNITLKRMDLSRKNLQLPACDFAVCVNVVMLPALEKNKAIIANIYKTLKPGGSAVFVVPSLESGIFATQRLIDWYAKDKTKPEEIPNSDFIHIPKSKLEMVQGLIRIDKEPTKHYLHVELLSVFGSVGFQVTAIEKMEYPWSTEFQAPPAWMEAPYPWDWMIECKKA